MSTSQISCAHCGTYFDRETGHVNRARKIGAHLFCNRICVGLARRVEATPEQKKEAKRLYDIAYRERDVAARKANRAAYFQRTYDPEKARAERKARMPAHIEYCRRPEYREWKRQYDIQYRAREFGEFAEVALILRDIEKEIDQRATRYEIYMTNGTINKAQTRRREL